MLTPGLDELDKLDEQIRKLKIQYDQFFRGVRKLPPIEDRKRVEEAMREMMKGKLRDNTSRFRYATINQTYNRFQELWSRQMREREEGPIDFKHRQAALRAAVKEESPHPPEAPRTTSRVTQTLDESYVKVAGASNGEAMKELHRMIAEANAAIGKPAPSEAQVKSLVEKQAEQMRGRYNVDAIAFKVETVDGKVKLKAKPVN